MPSATHFRAGLPVHCSAAGKAMAARLLWEGALRDIVGDEPFRKRTDATITTWPDLMAELDGVRKAGYALDREEREAEIYCIAAPGMDCRRPGARCGAGFRRLSLCADRRIAWPPFALRTGGPIGTDVRLDRLPHSHSRSVWLETL